MIDKILLEQAKGWFYSASSFWAFEKARELCSIAEQNNNKIVQNDLPINQPAEIRNETTKKVYLALDGCMLLDEKVGDYTIHFYKGTDPDLNKIGSND